MINHNGQRSLFIYFHTIILEYIHDCQNLPRHSFWGTIFLGGAWRLLISPR